MADPEYNQTRTDGLIRKTKAEFLADPIKPGEKGKCTDCNEVCGYDCDGNLTWSCNGNQIPDGSAGCCLTSTGTNPTDVKWLKGATGVFPNGEGQTLTIKDGVVIAIS